MCIRDRTTIDTLSGPLSKLQGTLAGHPVTIDVVEFIHARQLLPPGPYRRDLAPSTDWLLFGSGNDYFLAWLRVETDDPVQVVAVTARNPLPDRPLRVPLPVRALKILSLIHI